MKTATYSANVNGIFTHVKAEKKENAIRRFQMLDSNITASDVKKINVIHSHQATVESLYPEICK